MLIFFKKVTSFNTYSICHVIFLVPYFLMKYVIKDKKCFFEKLNVLPMFAP